MHRKEIDIEGRVIDVEYITIDVEDKKIDLKDKAINITDNAIDTEDKTIDSNGKENDTAGNANARAGNENAMVFTINPTDGKENEIAGSEVMAQYLTFIFKKTTTMKKLRLLLMIALSASLFTTCKNAPESADTTATEAKEVPEEGASDQTFTIQPSDSKIEWVGTKVSGYHTGNVPIKSGELMVKKSGVASGTFVLDLGNIMVTGPKGSKEAANDKLTGHLKSADFFEVDKYPTGTFEITRVIPFTETVAEADDPRQNEISKYKVTNPTHRVSGNLTLKGITKNIEFPAKITISGNSAEAIAKFNIDRTEWNIVYPGKPDDLIRKEVHLGISIKANRE